MSVAGLCVVYIYLVGFGAGKWPSQWEMVCLCGAVSGQQVVEGRVCISTVQLGITVVCWRVVSSL